MQYAYKNIYYIVQIQVFDEYIAYDVKKTNLYISDVSITS